MAGYTTESDPTEGEGALVYTTDGARAWKRNRRFDQRPLYSVMFADRQHGWVAGYNGAVYGTSDGGVTWAEELQLPAVRYEPILFCRAKDAVFVGTGGALYMQPLP